MCRITPLARTQSERRRRLALATGFRLLRLSGALDCHGSTLGGLRPQETALIGLDEVSLEVANALVPLLHACCNLLGGQLARLCNSSRRDRQSYDDLESHTILVWTSQLNTKLSISAHCRAIRIGSSACPSLSGRSALPRTDPNAFAGSVTFIA